MKKAISLLLLAFVMIAANTSADEAAMESGKLTSFEGKLVCLDCSLKQAEGARSACTVYGHDWVLMTKDGRYINFLKNDFSKDLLAGDKYADKEMTVSGFYHASANRLDVETFTVDGQKMGWCSHCSTMDSCPFKAQGKM